MSDTAVEQTTAPTTRRPAWHPRRLVDAVRRADPLVPLTGLVALLVYLPQGFGGAITRDEGVYMYGGQQAAEGVPPYVAILNRAGPLAHFVPGIAVWITRHVGGDDVIGIRFFFLLLSAAAVAAAYALGREMIGSRAAGLAGAAVLLGLHTWVYYATNGPREKTFMVLVLILGLLAMRRRRWATAGVCISLATLTWQPVLFGALPAVAVAALLQRRGRLRSLVLVAVGGIAPLALTVAAYALVGRLRVFWDCFFLINLRYTRQSNPLDQPGATAQILVRNYEWALWLVVAGLALVVLWAVLAARGPRRHEAREAALVGMGVFTVANLLWALKAFNGGPDAFVMFPSVIVGVGGLVPLLQRRLTVRVVRGAVAVWLVAAVAMTLRYTTTSGSHQLDEQRHDVAAVVAALPPGSRIFSDEAPQTLVLSHQRNLSRLQLFGSGLSQYVEATWPGGLEGYARWVGHRRPPVIALEDGRLQRWIRPLLHKSYEPVGSSPKLLWYARKSLGQTTLDRLRSVLA